MRKREKFDSEQMRELQEALIITEYGNEDKKVMRMLIEYENGESVDGIIDKYGVSKSKLFRTRNVYKDNGIEGIIQIRRGPKNKLNRNERVEVQEAIGRAINENNLNLTAKNIRKGIKSNYNVDLSLRTCQRLLYSEFHDLQGLIDKEEIQSWLDKNINNMNIFYTMPIWRTYAFEDEQDRTFVTEPICNTSILYLLFNIDKKIIYYAIGNRKSEEEYSDFYNELYKDGLIKDEKVLWIDENNEYIPQNVYIGMKTFYTISKDNWDELITNDRRLEDLYKLIKVIEETKESVEITKEDIEREEKREKKENDDKEEDRDGEEYNEKMKFIKQKELNILTIEDEMENLGLNARRLSI